MTRNSNIYSSIFNICSIKCRHLAKALWKLGFHLVDHGVQHRFQARHIFQEPHLGQGTNRVKASHW